MTRRRRTAGCLAFALCCGVALLPAPARPDERLDITATDGVQLIGELAGTSGPGVVLAHGENGDRRTWEAVSRTLASRGFRVLRFDLRGHGDSAGERDLTASDRDVEGGYRYLLGRKIRPVFLVGAGGGGTAALIVATRVPVEGVVTVSAPAAFAGLDGQPALTALRVPWLLIAASNDGAADALIGAADAAHVPTRVQRSAGSASGPSLLETPTAMDALLRFLSDPKGTPAPRGG